MRAILNYRSYWVVIFGIAFGLVEAAVVIYIRAKYYPEGFGFPLKPISSTIIWVELFREFATLMMLVAVGVLAGRDRIERFAYFLISFAVWDIFYYIFLKLFIQWPESFMTWDILFLIPITWFGPVIAPVFLSLLMIVLACLLLYFNKPLRRGEWFMLILGALVSIASFIEDYIGYLYAHRESEDIVHLSLTYVPKDFAWPLFSVAVVLILIVTGRYWRRNIG